MFKPEFNLLDIAKVVGIIYLVYFLSTKAPTMFDRYIDSESTGKTTIEQIAKNVSRAVVVENNKSVNEAIESIRAQSSAALKSVDDLGDRVTGIGAVTGTTPQNVEQSVEGSYFDDEDGARDLHTFLVYSGLETKDKSKMPIATVYYSPEIKDKTDRVSTDAHKIEFKANVIESVSKEGKSTRTVEAWAENIWSAESKGKKYPIDLYIDMWAIKKPPKSFMFNPNFALSLFANMDDFFPGLSMSLLSYGYTKKDVDWRFVSVFIGATDDDVMVGVSPVLYNIGNELPLVSNLFIGPFVGTDFDEVIYGVDVSIPF